MSASGASSTSGTATDCSTFKHARLADASNQIRLLRMESLEEGDWKQDVRCTIDIYDLGSKDFRTDFRAISYTWGQLDLVETIIINSKYTLTVRQNCAFALRQYRAHFADLPVWIDSICINQVDEAEKTKQIQLMGTIFSFAERVVACVGPHSDETEWMIGAVKCNQYYSGDAEQMEKLGKVCKDFGSRQYWTRLWIVQELLLAQRGTVLCGLSMIGLEEFRLWLTRCPVDFQIWRENLPAYAILTSQLPMSLYDNVRAYKTLECTERFDRVFALLGISFSFPNHDPPSTVNLDYEGPVVRLLLDIIRVSGPIQDSIVRFGQRVGCLADCLQLEEDELRWLSTAVPLQNVKSFIKRLEPKEKFAFVLGYKDKVWRSKTLAVMRGDFPEWIIENGGADCVRLDVDESAQIVCQGSDPPTIYNSRDFQGTRMPSTETIDEERLQLVWYNNEVVALAAGNIRPGDMILPKLANFGTYTIDEEYTYNYHLIARRDNSHVHRIVGLSLCDETAFRSLPHQNRPYMGSPLLVLRMSEACRWYAQHACRKRRRGPITDDDEERVDSRCFGNFQSLFGPLRSIKDDFCSEFVKTIVPASPDSAFVYFE